VTVPGEPPVTLAGKLVNAAVKVSLWFTYGEAGPEVWLTPRAMPEVVTVTVKLA
jgi:hypothetical protein